MLELKAKLKRIEALLTAVHHTSVSTRLVPGAFNVGV
jgi:hypothetical protein